MPPAALPLAARARGALRGVLAGHRAVGGPSGPLDLLRILAEELADGRTDLRLLAERWVQRYREGPDEFDPDSASALRHLATYHAPPDAAGGRGSAPLGRTLPVALAAADSLRNLVSATFHIAALTHPDPRPAWAAVAVNLALAHVLQGKRDFVPEVIEVLRNNAAPDELLAVVRRVPLARRPEPPAAGQDAVLAAGIALWLGYHEPRLERGLEWLAGAGPAAAPLAVAAGALLGGRDGADRVPGHLLPGDGELVVWDDLALRLVRLVPSPSPS